MIEKTCNTGRAMHSNERAAMMQSMQSAGPGMVMHVASAGIMPHQPASGTSAACSALQRMFHQPGLPFWPPVQSGYAAQSLMSTIWCVS